MNIPNIVLVKSLLIIASVIGIYFNDLALIFSNALEFSAGNLTNYILLIPLIILFILYRKRELLISIASKIDKSMKIDIILGVTLCILSIFIYIVGSNTLYALEYHMYSLPLFVAGSILLLFNMNMLKHLIFPVIILLYMQPPPGELVADLAADLSWISASMTESFLKTFGMPISLETSYGAPALVIVKDNANIPFYVGEPSSGVYSIIGLSLFGLFAAYIVKGMLWKRISIFVLGLPIFFLLNVLRIIIILVLWYNYGLDVSEAFHTVSGMVMAIIGTLVILVFSDKIMRMDINILPSIKSKPCIACNEHKELGEQFCLFCGRLLQTISRFDSKDIGRIALVVLVLVSGLIVQAYANVSVESTITDLDIASIEGPETTKYFLPEIEGWQLNYAYRDKRVESVLNQDAALSYRYTKDIDVQIKPSVYTGIQISTGRHSWEASMVIYPSRVGRPSAEVIELKDVNILDVKGRFFVYKRPNSNLTEAVLYWFERVPLRFGNNFEQRNVQIVLWSYVDSLSKSGLINNNDIKEVEDLYLSLAVPIKEHWNFQFATLLQENITNMLVEQSPLISILMIIPASLTYAYSYTNNKRMHYMLNRLYKRLSSDDKALIDAIKQSDIATTENVLNKYKDITNKDVSIKEIIDKLLLAKDNNLIIDEIINIDDKPRLVWRIV
ncbi:MAG: hypothetical protein KatS3mg003_0659 [Candidatus Nitrosocaldaceae archaeon]|nr:MAG: hypothetical protein KatS3mg003_0659 [Candidatus Nitrosocaldaceae archaeon]